MTACPRPELAAAPLSVLENTISVLLEMRVLVLLVREFA